MGGGDFGASEVHRRWTLALTRLGLVSTNPPPSPVRLDSSKPPIAPNPPPCASLARQPPPPPMHHLVCGPPSTSARIARCGGHPTQPLKELASYGGYRPSFACTALCMHRLESAPPCVYTALPVAPQMTRLLRVATDHLFVCTAFSVYRLSCGPLNNKTTASAIDRLLCAPPCVYTAFYVYRLACGP